MPESTASPSQKTESTSDSPADGASVPNPKSGGDAKKPLEITLSINVLNHLGINLYSNVPAVISEVVANCWDADAERVDISIDAKSGLITIADSGSGMSYADVNQRYLRVGYEKRVDLDGGVTPRLKRRPMGRKGIGKLSLFSIAEEYELHTVHKGERTAFRMNLSEVRAAIAAGTGTYKPTTIAPAADLNEGTRIVVTKSRKRLSQTESALKRRLARRFSVMGALNKFQIFINNTEVTIKDRGYFSKIQYLWEYGAKEERKSLCENVENYRLKKGIAVIGNKDGVPLTAEITGWIGTVARSSDLKDDNDNINQIVVMVRGKVAHEDVLANFSEGGLYTRYIIGELNADFLDVDEDDDIATSSRQKIVEDDPRFLGLLAFVQGELKEIEGKWTDLRDEGGKDKAVLIPSIKEWYQALGPDHKAMAKKLFGRINRLTVDSEEEKLTLFKHGVLAFESLRYKENLSALEKLPLGDIKALTDVFVSLDSVEAGLYYQIVKERISVIQALNANVKANALEKVVQAYIFKHLWLLDPSWERATDAAYMEQQVQTEFAKLDAKLTEAEKDARIDIKYKLVSGSHVVVELKRPGRVCTTFELGEQVRKYRSALRKLLQAAGRGNESIAIVCIVGQPLQDWADPEGRDASERSLGTYGARVVMYQELLDNASRQYQSYIDKSGEASRVFDLLKRIEIEVAANTGGPPAVTAPAASGSAAPSVAAAPSIASTAEPETKPPT